jgi:hypothetical protein
VKKNDVLRGPLAVARSKFFAALTLHDLHAADFSAFAADGEADLMLAIYAFLHFNYPLWLYDPAISQAIDLHCDAPYLLKVAWL